MTTQRNKIGIFIAPDPGMTNLEALRQAAQAGAAAFEPMAAHELAGPDLNAARILGEEAARLDMHIPCLSVGVDLSRPESVERLKRYADVVRAMGADCLHHTLYPALDPAHKAPDFDSLLKTVAANAREVFDYAASLGIPCIYEEQGLQFNGCERYSAFLKELDRPAGVVLDMGNIAFVGERPDDFARMFAGRIVHVHVKDYAVRRDPDAGGYTLADGAHLVPTDLCEGDMPVKETLSILRGSGYDGWYTLECEPVRDGYAEQKKNLDTLNALLNNLH